MGSHYYDVNLPVDKQLVAYRDWLGFYKSSLAKLGSSTEEKVLAERIRLEKVIKTSNACIEYLLECEQKGVKYISVADLPLH